MISGFEHKKDIEAEPGFDQILKNPILDIAARFWEEDRYQAFRICYRSMRYIDDLIDNRKGSAEAIKPGESRQLRAMIANWFNSIQKGNALDSTQAQLVETLERFLIPLWPWEVFCRAMKYDLDHNGYSSHRGFLRYAEGAAVAPAAIFMHLCGLSTEDGSYCKPGFDIRKAARPLALFCYLVHIIRDFQKDQLEGLNYFAVDLMREHGLTILDLRAIAESGQASDSFRDLMATYIRFARFYQKKSLINFDKTLPHLEDRYKFSLLIIYNLYLLILERVDVKSGNFTTDELNPPPEEIKKRIKQAIATFEG